MIVKKKNPMTPMTTFLPSTFFGIIIRDWSIVAAFCVTVMDFGSLSSLGEGGSSGEDAAAGMLTVVEPSVLLRDRPISSRGKKGGALLSRLTFPDVGARCLAPMVSNFETDKQI